MNIALICDTWTIISTLTTGALIGIFIVVGGVALGIRHDAKRRLQRKEELEQHRVGKVAQINQPVYDQSIHDH